MRTFSCPPPALNDKDLRFDGYAIENNFVSITPLRYNLTDFSYMKILKKDFKIE